MRMRRNKGSHAIVARVAPKRSLKGRLTQKEVFRRVVEAWDQALERGFGLSEDDARKMVRGLFAKGDDAVDFTNDKQTGLQLQAMVRFTVGHMGRRAFRKGLRTIKTEDQLQKVCSDINRVADELPTLIRKWMKVFTTALPRRGGPGRHSKLNTTEAASACDHIATFIRRGLKTKQALQRVAEASEALLGKKIGARTLQKAWNNRSKEVSI
jgi:hypothetical protein